MPVRGPDSASIRSYCLVPQKLTVIDVGVVPAVMKTAVGLSLRNLRSNTPQATVASRPGSYREIQMECAMVCTRSMPA